ncbi:MAG: hypothetical protein H6546_07595 [Chitinophagales bacterium]|nr:hypothetical protein [Chitinophagales bacterium]
MGTDYTGNLSGNLLSFDDQTIPIGAYGDDNVGTRMHYHWLDLTFELWKCGIF